jgi:hypothetical protein
MRVTRPSGSRVRSPDADRLIGTNRAMLPRTPFRANVRVADHPPEAFAVSQKLRSLGLQGYWGIRPQDQSELYECPTDSSNQLFVQWSPGARVTMRPRRSRRVVSCQVDAKQQITRRCRFVGSRISFLRNSMGFARRDAGKDHWIGTSTARG